MTQNIPSVLQKPANFVPGLDATDTILGLLVALVALAAGVGSFLALLRGTKPEDRVEWLGELQSGHLKAESREVSSQIGETQRAVVGHLVRREVSRVLAAAYFPPYKVFMGCLGAAIWLAIIPLGATQAGSWRFLFYLVAVIFVGVAFFAVSRMHIQRLTFASQLAQGESSALELDSSGTVKNLSQARSPQVLSLLIGSLLSLAVVFWTEAFTHGGPRSAIVGTICFSVGCLALAAYVVAHSAFVGKPAKRGRWITLLWTTIVVVSVTLLAAFQALIQISDLGWDVDIPLLSAFSDLIAEADRAGLPLR